MSEQAQKRANRHNFLNFFKLCGLLRISELFITMFLNSKMFERIGDLMGTVIALLIILLIHIYSFLLALLMRI